MHTGCKKPVRVFRCAIISTLLFPHHKKESDEMLKLNPRNVTFVHLRDGTRKDTHNVTVEGFNDEYKRYEITLRGIGGPDSPTAERAVVAHIQTLHELGLEAHISHKYPVLLYICGFVGHFFEPHYGEE